MKFKVKQNYKSTMSLDGETKDLVLIEGDEVEIDDPRVAAFVEKDSPGTLVASSKTGKDWLAGLGNRQIVEADAVRTEADVKNKKDK